jgi:hypothetical protein
VRKIDQIVKDVEKEVAEIIDSPMMPNDKRSAVAIIELRTKLEIRTIALKASLAINTGLIAGLVGHFLFR